MQLSDLCVSAFRKITAEALSTRRLPLLSKGDQSHGRLAKQENVDLSARRARDRPPYQCCLMKFSEFNVDG